MIRPLMIAVGLTVGFLGLSVPVAQAQNGKQAVAVKGERMTQETLLELFRNMGYDPDVKEGYFRIKFRNGSWTHYLLVELSKDQSVLFLTIPLDQLPDPKNPPADALLQLLAMNSKISPAHFAFEAGPGWMVLQRALDNRQLTAVTLREEFEDLRYILSKTIDLWDTSKWSNPDTKARLDKKLNPDAKTTVDLEKVYTEKIIEKSDVVKPDVVKPAKP